MRKLFSIVFWHILLAVGFDTNYLKLNLIGFCCAGASIMLGCKAGVSVRIEEIFPNIIIWYCLGILKKNLLKEKKMHWKKEPVLFFQFRRLISIRNKIIL